MSLLLFKKTLPAGAGASSWTPADLGASLKVWYKTPLALANGAAVTTWPDSSGNGNDATQAAGAAGDYVYKTNAQNGNAVVGNLNSGVNPSLVTGLINFPAGFSTYMVLHGFDIGADLHIAHDGVPYTFWGWSLAGSYFYLFNTSSSTSTPSGVITGWNILSASWTNAGMVAGLNGVDGTPVTAVLDMGITPRTLKLADSGYANGYRGDWGEVIICVPKLSPTDHSNVITYLKTRWAIS